MPDGLIFRHACRVPVEDMRHLVPAVIESPAREASFFFGYIDADRAATSSALHIPKKNLPWQMPTPLKAAMDELSEGILVESYELFVRAKEILDASKTEPIAIVLQ